MFMFFTCLFCFGIPPTVVERGRLTLQFGPPIKGLEGFCWGIHCTLLCHQLYSAAAALHVLRIDDRHLSTVCIISDRPHSGVEDCL